MIKKFTLLLVMLLTMVGSMSAKTFENTLWEGDTSGEVFISADKFSSAKAGDVIRIYFTCTANESFHVVYKIGESDSWAEHTFDGIGSWPWCTTDMSQTDLVINATDLTTLQTYGIYIYGKAEKLVITKVTLAGEVATTSETELLDANWPASWDAKAFAAQASAKIGDVIRFSYSAPGGWSYFQFNILDAYGNADAFENKSSNVGTSIETAADLYFEFEITNISDLKKIQNEGFGIKGDNFTLTSVQLLSYADSYDAVSITVGSDGIATYSNGGKNVQISACDGLKAYYASAVAKGIVTLTELTGCIPANTGVIVYGSEGTYTVPVGSEDWPGDVTNYLKPTGDNSQEVPRSGDGKFRYIFAKHGDNIGFYMLSTTYVESGNPYHTLAAHKAYLETDEDVSGTVAGSRGLSLDFGDGTTAIWNTVEDKIDTGNVREDGVYYTLQGTRVQNPSKGLYILNGKKVFIK